MEELEIINPYQVHALTRQLCKEGPAILTSDKRNKNGFSAFQFCYYKKFQLLSDEQKELYVGGRYRLLPRGPQPMPDLPDDIDGEDDDAMLQFFQPTHTGTYLSTEGDYLLKQFCGLYETIMSYLERVQEQRYEYY